MSKTTLLEILGRKTGAMKKTKLITLCGMMSALAVVIMLVGGYLEIGMYAAPMISGLLLMPVGDKYGKKYHFAMWAVVSIISFILVPYVEQNLMFLLLFGLYPAIYSFFGKIPKTLRLFLKFLYFNITFMGIEALVMLVLVPEVMSLGMIAVFLVLGNITFILYDLVLPRAEFIFKKYLGKLMK